MENKKKITIYDIADALGISVGTVNRALHNKPRISPETKRRVLEKAAELGFQASQTAQSLRRRPIRIGIVMFCAVPQYLHEIRRGMDAAFRQLNEFNVFGEYYEISDPDVSVCEKKALQILQSFAAEESAHLDGLVLFLSGNNTIFPPVVARLTRMGIPVATVTNDVCDSQRVLSVCTDGYCAGSLAAELLHLCSVKKAAILAGSLGVTIHRENIKGFLQYAETHPFSVVEVYEHQDDVRLLHATAVKLFTDHPDLEGIYITSAISPLACAEICALGYGKKVKIITTDLFDETRELLRQGIVCGTIFQDPYKQGKDVVEKLYYYICGRPVAGSYYISPQLILTSNRNQYLCEAESYKA